MGITEKERGLSLKFERKSCDFNMKIASALMYVIILIVVTIIGGL